MPIAVGVKTDGLLKPTVGDQITLDGEVGFEVALMICFCLHAKDKLGPRLNVLGNNATV